MAALNMMSINVILSSFLLFSFVECTETMMNDNNKNNGNNVIATDANDGNNPHNFMWDNWEHHKNLNLHLPSSGTCLTESNIDSCKLFKSCSWHDETSKCYLSADPDEIYKPIPMNMNSNQRILQELTFPENGCASIRNQGMCAYYTGCYWVRSAGCFTVRTPKPSSGSPTRAPSKKSYPPDGACSSAKSKLSCNLYSRCIWDVSTSGTPFCRQVRAGEIGGGDTPSRSPTSRPVPANPTPYPTYPNATPRPSRHPVNTPTRKQGTAKPTKGTITCAFPDNGCSSIRDGAASCVSFEGCAWSATKRACVTQKACTGNHSPSSTPKPTIPRQDTPTVDQMCQVPSGGCRNAAARDCGKYTGCYVFGGFCTERTCDKFDCGIRKLGFDFAAKILPRCQAKVSPNVGMDDCISELKDIHDGLELNARCGLKFNEGNHQTNGISKVPNLPMKRYYVSTTGDDGRGDGSFSKPYKTIQKALEVSRNSPSTPRAIILRAGTHYITETIVLTPQDSKLTIAPYENEKVTVSGAIPLEGIEWKHYNTKILVADVSQYSSKLGHLSQIFFDNIPATRARHPNADPWTQGLFTKKNTGYFDDAESWTSAIDNGPSSVVIKQDIRTQSSRYSKFSLGYGGNCGIFTPPASYWAVRNPVAGGGCMFEVPRGVTVRPSHLAGIPTPFRRVSDAYIHAYHVYLWGNWIFRVGGQNGRTFNFQGGGFQEARGSCGKGGQQYYIENMLELLDAKNEFYLDTLEKKLYYYPNATASDPTKIPNAFATVNRRIFHIAGDSTNPVKDVTIAGLKIEKTYATWMDPHEVPSAGDWSVTRNGAIFIEGGENISVYGNSFYYMGGNGVFVSNYARNVKITANRFKYLAQSAILVVGDHRYNTENPWEMLDPNHPFDTVVDGNIASEIGNVVKQSAGFFQALARGSIVQNNVFFNSERTAVNFNDGYGGDNKVYSNLMFNTVRSTIDHGPFNSWDRQAYIQSHPGSNFQPVSEPMMSYVKGNYLLGGYGGIKGIDHDDGTTWWENSNNLLVYTYQKLKGRNQESYNNLVMFPVDYAVFLSEPIGVGSSKLAWHDNTVVTGFGSDPYGFGSEDLCLRQNFQADNNEVWVQTQFWARCTPSTPRTWDEWKSERNQDKTSTVRKYLPTNLQMVKWGYDKLGLDSSLVN